MCEELKKVVIDINAKKYFRLEFSCLPKKERNCWLSLGRMLMFLLEALMKL